MTHFEAHLAALIEFGNLYGHLNVPEDYVSPDGLTIGTWAVAQRRLAGLLHYPARFRAALHKIGFVWNPRESCKLIADDRGSLKLTPDVSSDNSAGNDNPPAGDEGADSVPRMRG